MVKAELSYNPYLLSTNIVFNGQEPRINSLVERYQDGFLEDWVKDLPYIFYGEMNGYDFELDFSGTELDYKEVCESFNQAGVSEKQVKVFHKGELADREKKYEQIQDLFSWLSNNPNHLFDIESFLIDNSRLVDNAFIVKVISPEALTMSNTYVKNVSIEMIDNVDELSEIDLLYVPVIYVVNKKSIKKLPDFLSLMKRKNNVTDQQLFFIIDSEINSKETRRIIQDLGILHPQIINTINDSNVKKYFEIYPVSDYIHKSILEFESEKENIISLLDEEISKSEYANSSINQEIEECNEKLGKLKASYDLFQNRDNYELPQEFNISKGKLIDRLRNWQNRKGKTSNDDEAERLADDLNAMMSRAIGQFVAEIEKTVEVKRNAINAELKHYYYKAMCNEENPITIPELKKHEKVLIPVITKNLLDINVENKESSNGKASFFFGSSKQDVADVVWPLQEWRKYVETIASPIADKLIKECSDSLIEYYNNLAEAYMRYLDNQIKQLSQMRDSKSELLSDDAKLLQIDKVWLEELSDKLNSIERG